MKRLLFIFAAYLLALSCFPCMCDDGPQQLRLQQATGISKQANDTQDDNCNPFCACSCCLSSTFSYQKEFQIAAPVTFNDSPNFSFSVQHFTSHNSNTIWQPPKAG